MRDYKNYEAQDGALFAKTLTWLIVAAVFAAVAYASESDYRECLNNNQSVTLCGGGNTK